MNVLVYASGFEDQINVPRIIKNYGNEKPSREELIEDVRNFASTEWDDEDIEFFDECLKDSPHSSCLFVSNVLISWEPDEIHHHCWKVCNC